MKYLMLVLSMLLFACQGKVEQTSKANGTVDPANETSKGTPTIADSTEYRDDGTIARTGMLVRGEKSGVWKTYNKEGTLTAAEEYGNGKLMFELDASDFSFVPVNFDSGKAEIELPEKWQPEEADNPHLLLARLKNCGDSIAFCPTLTITDERLKDGIDFQHYLQFSFGRLQESLSQFKPVAQGALTIDSLQAFQMTYLMKANGVKLGGITTCVNRNGTVYVISGMAINEVGSEFLKYKGLFQEITGTFKQH